MNWTAIADEEYANKKICTRILRLRAQPNTKFEAEEFKRTAMASMATSGEVAAFRNKAKEKITSQSRTGSHQSSRSDKGADKNDNVRKSRDSALEGGSDLSEDIGKSNSV